MEELLEVLPIYGTYKSGERFINNPSWGNAGELAFNLGSDVLTFTGIGAVAKGLKAANVARKAYKTARATEKAYDAVRYGMNKLSPKIKHNNDVIHSLSLDNQRTGLKLLTDRVRSNNKLINEYKTKANNANKLYNKITEDYNIYSLVGLTFSGVDFFVAIPTNNYMCIHESVVMEGSSMDLLNLFFTIKSDDISNYFVPSTKEEYESVLQRLLTDK